MQNLRTSLMLVLGLAATVSARQAASDAWVAEPAAGDTTAVAYLSISNPTAYDIYVVSASSTVAERVEIRHGAGAAEKVVKVITVSSYGFAELKPSEEHLVLVNLKRPLKTGETVDLTLKTDGGITLNVSAAVKKPQ